MIIIAGELRVAAGDRDRYLAAVADVARSARLAPGCLDFVQAADPIDPERINIYERWDSDEELHRFRTSGGPPTEVAPTEVAPTENAEIEVPELRSADVRKYRIAAVEDP